MMVTTNQKLLGYITSVLKRVSCKGILPRDAHALYAVAEQLAWLHTKDVARLVLTIVGLDSKEMLESWEFNVKLAKEGCALQHARLL
jgi:hypothetical protein